MEPEEIVQEFSNIKEILAGINSRLDKLEATPEVTTAASTD